MSLITSPIAGWFLGVCALILFLGTGWVAEFFAALFTPLVHLLPKDDRSSIDRSSTPYWYMYQVHPFDNPRFFAIRAESKSAANKKAISHMVELSAQGRTFMRQCIPIDHEPRYHRGFKHRSQIDGEHHFLSQ